MLRAMNIADPLGTPGAPQDTWQAMQRRLDEVNQNQADPQRARLILVTDRQGDRLHAGYAALVTLGQGEGETAVLSAPAFGPRYGEAGQQALTELVRWAEQAGLATRETVLSSGDYQRVLAEPEAQEVAALIAASNPADPAIYTTPLPRREDDWG